MSIPNDVFENVIHSVERDRKRKARAVAYTFAFLLGVPILVALWAVAHMP